MSYDQYPRIEILEDRVVDLEALNIELDTRVKDLESLVHTLLDQVKSKKRKSKAACRMMDSAAAWVKTKWR